MVKGLCSASQLATQLLRRLAVFFFNRWLHRISRITLEETSCTFFTREAMSSECLGWSRSRTGRFVDSIDKRLFTGTGYALRSTELGELCIASQYTVWTQFS